MNRSSPDHYTKKAKRSGYAARSVYKLAEIQEKLTILRPGSRVLDVGAAPGSWSQFALNVIGRSGFLCAVDIKPIHAVGPGDNRVLIEGTIEDEAVIARLGQHGPYDAIISDAAPSTTGNRSVDTARSEALFELVFSLASRLLLPGGSFTAKLFQGGGEQRLLQEIRNEYRKGRIMKPAACRKNSFEIYLVGIDKQVKKE
jgi:23S rRNA (uridine2552-2'-O)-methyltransferase